MSDLTKLLHQQLWDLVKAKKKKAAPEPDMAEEDGVESDPGLQGVVPTRQRSGKTRAAELSNRTGRTSQNLEFPDTVERRHQSLGATGKTVEIGGAVRSSSLLRQFRRTKRGKTFVSIADPITSYAVHSALDENSGKGGMSDAFARDFLAGRAKAVKATAAGFRSENKRREAQNRGSEKPTRLLTDRDLAHQVIQGRDPRSGNEGGGPSIGRRMVGSLPIGGRTTLDASEQAIAMAHKNMGMNMRIATVAQFMTENGVKASYNPETSDWKYDFGEGEEGAAKEAALKAALSNPQAYLSQGRKADVKLTDFPSARIVHGSPRIFNAVTGREITHRVRMGNRTPQVTSPEPTAADYMTSDSGIGKVRDKAPFFSSTGRPVVEGVPKQLAMTAKNEVYMGGESGTDVAVVENPKQFIAAGIQSTTFPEGVKAKLRSAAGRMSAKTQTANRRQASEVGRRSRERSNAVMNAARQPLSERE